jgi:hypothetical protein
LEEDGVNWPDWDAAITATITRVFEFKGYLVTADPDKSHDRAALTGVLIEHSIHPTLVALVRGKTGRAAFHILQNRFASVSWTYVMSRWLKASNPSDILSDLNTAYSEMTTCLTEIEKHVGGITKDLVLALLLHQRCQPHFQAIANALDVRIAVDASQPINSKTILELAGRFATAGVAADLSVFAYWAQRGPGGPTAGTSSGGQQGSQQGGSGRKTMEGKSNSWARRVLTKANPCQWCYEWGHWAKDCPLKKAKKPPVVDPRLQNPGYRLKRSTVCHPGLLQRGPASATVASVEKQLSGEEQALIDSGATDSVTNNVRFLPLCGQFA